MTAPSPSIAAKLATCANHVGGSMVPPGVGVAGRMGRSRGAGAGGPRAGGTAGATRTTEAGIQTPGRGSPAAGLPLPGIVGLGSAR